MNIDEERFWRKVDKRGSDECWLWLDRNKQPTNPHSYGSLRIGDHTMRAHRVSWIIHYGLIPKGLWVLHHCDNPSCVNPSHLFLGNAQDNYNDMAKKGRQRVWVRSKEVNPIITIGSRIMRARNAKGWTRRTLSLLSGYTEQSIVTWELDKQKPSERAIRALEKAFGEQLRK